MPVWLQRYMHSSPKYRIVISALVLLFHLVLASYINQQRAHFQKRCQLVDTIAMTIGSYISFSQQNDDKQMFSNMIAHKLRQIVNEEDKVDKQAELLACFPRRTSQYQALERTSFPDNYLSDIQNLISQRLFVCLTTQVFLS